MSYIDWLGWAAALLTLATFSMKTMISLRVIAIASNIAFMSYGALAHIYPVIALHSALLPFNIFRLVQMRRLIASAGKASNSRFDLNWIRPYATVRDYREGETIFKKGDQPDLLYYLSSGSIRLSEINAEIRPGNLFGEIAFFAPEQGRTVTAICKTSVQVFCLDADTLKQLYFPNPSFGFYLMHLVAGRLSENLLRLEAQQDGHGAVIERS